MATANSASGTAHQIAVPPKKHGSRMSSAAGMAKPRAIETANEMRGLSVAWK